MAFVRVLLYIYLLMFGIYRKPCFVLIANGSLLTCCSMWLNSFSRACSRLRCIGLTTPYMCWFTSHTDEKYLLELPKISKMFTGVAMCSTFERNMDSMRTCEAISVKPAISCPVKILPAFYFYTMLYLAHDPPAFCFWLLLCSVCVTRALGSSSYPQVGCSLSLQATAVSFWFSKFKR